MPQCFSKGQYHTAKGEKMPRLLYINKEERNAHPRVIHAHEHFAELLLFAAGEGDCTIGDQRYSIRANDIVIYNSGVVHDESFQVSDEISYYCLAVDNLFLDGLRENALIPDDVPPIFAGGFHFETLGMLTALMYKNLYDEEPGADETCHHLLLALLARLQLVVRDNRRQFAEKTMEQNVMGKRIKEYLDQHFCESISLQTIAHELNISPFYLAHVFKQYTGYSPMQYILRRRIGEAQTLLVTTDYSITQIASIVGYDNPSNFHSIFSKNVGLSPRNFRKYYVQKYER